MNTKFFRSVSHTIFLRLQVYKAIAAIFWQSASYVLIFRRFFLRNVFCNLLIVAMVSFSLNEFFLLQVKVATSTEDILL